MFRVKNKDGREKDVNVFAYNFEHLFAWWVLIILGIPKYGPSVFINSLQRQICHHIETSQMNWLVFIW